MILPRSLFYFFFFNDTATTEIYTLSLHDALPIAQPERALLQHRHVADAVLGGEVEGGRQSMTAAADDHHAVALARCRLRPGARPAALAGESLEKHSPERIAAARHTPRTRRPRVGRASCRERV